MKQHWLVTVSFMLPYPREFTYRVEATHQMRAPAAALPMLKKDPTLKGKRLGKIRMKFAVEPMGIIE